MDWQHSTEHWCSEAADIAQVYSPATHSARPPVTALCPVKLAAPCRTASKVRNRRRARTVYSAEAIAFLEQRFYEDAYPDYESRRLYAKTLGVKEDRIQVWFQNKRSRCGERQCKKKATPTAVEVVSPRAVTSAECTSTDKTNQSALSSVSYNLPNAPHQPQVSGYGVPFSNSTPCYAMTAPPLLHTANTKYPLISPASTTASIPAQQHVFSYVGSRPTNREQPLLLDAWEDEVFYSLSEQQGASSTFKVPSLRHSSTLKVPSLRHSSLEAQLNSPTFLNSFSPLLPISPLLNCPSAFGPFTRESLSNAMP